MREKQKEIDAVEQEKRYEEHGGPWKVPEPEVTSLPEMKEVDPELLVKSSAVDTEKKNSYVPPHLRNKQAVGVNLAAAPLRSTRRTAAPAIENVSEFPVLGSDASESKRPEAAAASGVNVNVENKYSALTSNH